MEEHRETILWHSRRYPAMEIEDYLKLFYQNSFGPGHFENPDFETIKERLVAEQSGLNKPSRYPSVENIGHGYKRVYLPIKEEHLEVLAENFHRSLEASPGKTEKRLHLFRAQVDCLLELIKDGEIPLSFSSCKAAAEKYLKGDMPPLRHSEAYRQAYAPHYRVVEERFLNSTLKIQR